MTPWEGGNFSYRSPWLVNQKQNNGRSEAVNTFYANVLSRTGVLKLCDTAIPLNKTYIHVALSSTHTCRSAKSQFCKCMQVPVKLYSDSRNVKKFTKNYWVLGLFPLSGILENRKHDDSETGSVSVLM
jgi:hypothetical protein